MKILITGGAGFIGSNVANRHLERGDNVIVFDNFSRKGCRDNVHWLGRNDSKRLRVIHGDVRNAQELSDAVGRDIDVLYHLAGQVAVTHSVSNPRLDFESNALGTFHALESVRTKCPKATFIYASTNKVYGKMDGMSIREGSTRYTYVNHPYGVSEIQPIDFRTPYGCSKGCGDQYACDYARTFGIKTVVFRQSCIYGPRQFGVEDQGWAAHFCIAAKNNRPVVVYGNGKQVRDMLWIDDLLDAYDQAISKIDAVAGSVFNIGGGPDNTVSVWREFDPLLQSATGRKVSAKMEPWRPGDQMIYVSDIRKLQKQLDWTPKISIETGLARLWNWVRNNEFL